MSRIDSNVSIDTSLIICAEYQLFIDDMRAQGKYFQPDHWISYQFPEGQAREPIVGVRPSDAIAFCEWLTQSKGEGWRYRIPLDEEAKSFPLSDSDTNHFGYWVTVSPDLPLMIYRTSKAESGLTFTINTVNDDAVAKAFAKNPNINFVDKDINYSRYCTYARVLALARETSNDLVNAINRAVTRDLSRYSDIEKNFGLALEIIRGRIRSAEVFLAATDEGVRVRDNNIDFICDSNLTVDMDWIKELKLVRDRFLDRSLTNSQGHNRDLIQAYATDLDLIIAGLIDIVLNISIPKLRRMGMSMPFVGIRVVKERRLE